MHFCLAKFTSNFSSVIFFPQSAAVAAQWIFRPNLSVGDHVVYKQPAGAGRSCPTWTPLKDFQKVEQHLKSQGDIMWRMECLMYFWFITASVFSVQLELVGLSLWWPVSRRIYHQLWGKSMKMSPADLWPSAFLPLLFFFFNLTMDCYSPVELTFRVFHPFLRNVFKRSALHR